MKYRDIIRRLEADGWFWACTSGSHRIYKHPVKRNIVVVPAHNEGRDVPQGTAQSIIKQAGLK